MGLFCKASNELGFYTVRYDGENPVREHILCHVSAFL